MNMVVRKLHVESVSRSERVGECGDALEGLEGRGLEVVLVTKQIEPDTQFSYRLA